MPAFVSIAICLILWLHPPAATGQPAPSLEVPDEIQAMAREMQFDSPTRIGGRVLMLDTYDEAIWLEWTEVFAAGRWHPVASDRQFIVYPRTPAMMEFFRRLKPGAVLRMTVQTGQDGKRRVIELEGT
jgi:hypothetical protein